MVTCEIDGQSVTVPEGTSIMRAAADLGIMVPLSMLVIILLLAVLFRRLFW